MRCRCGANLLTLSRDREPMLRTSALVLKAEGVVAVCPKCRADVPVAGELAKAIQTRLSPRPGLIFLKARPPAAPIG